MSELGNLVRLNGWQRIWLVICVLSLVAALVFGLREVNLTNRIDYGVVSGFESPKCDYIRKLPAGFKLDDEPAVGSPCYDLYTYKLYYSSPARSAQEYKDRQSEEYWKAFWLTELLMMVTWAIGMALLYGAGATVAWVLRGFRGNARPE